jgi:hypothetical protein
MKFVGHWLTGMALMFLAAAAVPAQGKKMLEGKGTGTIKGKVTFEGEAPKNVKVKIDASHKDAEHCLKNHTEDLTWVVDSNKGLANVVVFLKPPAGSVFKVDMSKKTWPEEVVIDQPYCAFLPHVNVIFPEYNGQRTGQKFIVKNSAPILHNSRIAGSPFRNPLKNETLSAGKEKAFELKADNQVIKMNCDAHKWMECFIWAFDHPYAAITKSDGTFEIKNVPLGVDLSVMAWHEMGTPPAGKEIHKGPLTDGQTFNFSIKK